MNAELREALSALRQAAKAKPLEGQGIPQLEGLIVWLDTVLDSPGEITDKDIQWVERVKAALVGSRYLSVTRHICTKDDPWDSSKGSSAVHPDAAEVGLQEDGWPSGDMLRYECPHCKETWREELPQ